MKMYCLRLTNYIYLYVRSPLNVMNYSKTNIVEERASRHLMLSSKPVYLNFLIQVGHLNGNNPDFSCWGELVEGERLDQLGNS